MQWSVLELQKYLNEHLAFAEVLDIKKDLVTRNTDLLDISLAKAYGALYVNENEYLLHYQLEVTLTLPSTRSLTPVSLPLNFSVTEVFMTQEQFDKHAASSGDEDILILEEEIISLDDSVKDNILLNIPLQVLSEEEKNNASYHLKGEAWQVMSESQYEAVQKEKKKLPLADLKDSFEEK